MFPSYFRYYCDSAYSDILDSDIDSKRTKRRNDGNYPPLEYFLCTPHKSFVHHHSAIFVTKFMRTISEKKYYHVLYI